MLKTLDEQLDEILQSIEDGTFELIPCAPTELDVNDPEVKKRIDALYRLNGWDPKTKKALAKTSKTRVHRAKSAKRDSIDLQTATDTRLTRKAKREH